MKTELILLIQLVTLTLAVVVPAVDQKVTVGAVAIEPVESTESTESLENNDPIKVSIVDVTKKGVSQTGSVESAESTESIVSAESTESSVDNNVLKTSDTSHRRYHYPRYRYPQYYRRPVAYSGYYNQYPQHNVNRYSYNRPSYYTRPSSYSQYSYYDSDYSSGGSDSGGGEGGGGDAGGGCRRKRGSRSKRCGGGD